MPWLHKNQLQVSNTGTLFFNYSSAVLDAPPHDVDFKFSPPTKQVTKIHSLLTSLTSGIFTASGMIKWSGPEITTEKMELWSEMRFSLIALARSNCLCGKIISSNWMTINFIP